MACSVGKVGKHIADVALTVNVTVNAELFVASGLGLRACAQKLYLQNQHSMEGCLRSIKLWNKTLQKKKRMIEDHVGTKTACPVHHWPISCISCYRTHVLFQNACLLHHTGTYGAAHNAATVSEKDSTAVQTTLKPSGIKQPVYAAHANIFAHSYQTSNNNIVDINACNASMQSKHATQSQK